MDRTTFASLLDFWMKNGAYQLLFDAPSGSGVFRVIDIPGAQYHIRPWLFLASARSLRARAAAKVRLDFWVPKLEGKPNEGQ